MKANVKQCANGYQYQKLVNKAIPTIASIFNAPVGFVRPMVTFRPPASSIPEARAAPNFARASSCLFVMTFSNVCRKERTLGHKTSLH